MDLLQGVRISAEVSFVLSQFTRLTDGQTDRRIPPCIVCGAVKCYLQNSNLRITDAALSIVRSPDLSGGKCNV